MMTATHENEIAAENGSNNKAQTEIENRDNEKPLDSTSSKWRSFDPIELGSGGTYGLGVSTIVPRPVAVITTVSENGIINCAPFSYTGLLSHDPPLVAHGICMSSLGKKDTLVNIEASKSWVYNVLSDSWVHQANACSAGEACPDVSELKVARLSTLPSENIKAPRIEEALVSMECELESIKEVYNDDGKHTTTIVFGRIVKYHIHNSVLTFRNDDEKRPVIDLNKMRFVGRAGDITYWPCGEGTAVPMKRPSRMQARSSFCLDRKVFESNGE